MDVLRDHRQNDLRHDRDGHRVRCNAKTDGHCDHRLRVGDYHRMDFRDVDDQNLGVNLYVSHDLHMNDQLGDRLMADDHRDDLMTDGNRVIRNCVRHDLMTDGNLDGKRDLRMNDLLDDH